MGTNCIVLGQIGRLPGGNKPIFLLHETSVMDVRLKLPVKQDKALFYGSSIGGARPKALVENQGSKYVAKFSSSTDIYSLIKAEYIAMRLAALAGLDVAPVRMTQAAKRDVLLIEL